MSRPSSPAASCLRLPSSSSLRFCAFSRGLDRAACFGHHHHAVVVGHDHVARLDIDAGADHRHVDRAERRLDRALGRDRPRPHRESPSPCSAFTSRQPASMTRPMHAARLQRGRQQFAEHAVGVVGGAADHQHVALLALLDGDVDHPVVARLRQHGDGAARRSARRPRSAACRASSGRSGRAPRARWRRRTAASVPTALGSARLMLRTTTGFMRSQLRSTRREQRLIGLAVGHRHAGVARSPGCRG